MKFPFSIEQFLEVFKAYNQQIFPFQILFYIIALTAIFLALKKSSLSGELISLILSMFWLWMGIVYHMIYFSEINKAAWLFGILFTVEAFILFWIGVLKGLLTFEIRTDVYGITGAIFILLALFIYPLLSYYSGHIYPSTPSFGLPCPTTIFTLGLLCWLDKKPSLIVWAIPILWSLIGFTASFSLGIKEDISLLIAGIVTVILLIAKRQKLTSRSLTNTLQGTIADI